MAAGAIVLFTANHAYVTTPSMYPTIPPGSDVFISHESTYKPGDVIEFHANGLTWVHRLIQIKPDGSYVTKGDNPENAVDVFVPALTKSAVIGKVTHVVRWAGFPELILHHPSYGLGWLRAELGLTGRIVLVAVFALVAFGIALRPTRRVTAKDANASASADAEPDTADAAVPQGT